MLLSPDLPPLPHIITKMPSDEPSPKSSSPPDPPSPPPPPEASSPAKTPSPPAGDRSPSPEPRRPVTRSGRLPRACTARTASRLRPPSPPPAPSVDPAVAKREREERLSEARAITPLLVDPAPGQAQRWELRSMWQLASLLNFLNVFRPLLNITVEFSAEELETALVTPNNTLDDVHMPLLKAIPPITRMALGRTTWVTVLCRKLKDWWHWVGEGEIPIVASQGAEIETYKTLEPGTRVLILKALCDIRVEQDDVRSYIENSLKHGIQLSAFRRERIGGDSRGVSYWYEDDPIIGHRLYREIRHVEHVEVKKVKGKSVTAPSIVSYKWETVATNLDEFQEVSDKLFSSKNRTEVSLGKKLKIDILPDIEKECKKKEKALKKQHRQALLLDTYVLTDGISSGRALRDRKKVTYTFDDYDRSITEAIKVTKKRQNSAEPPVKKDIDSKPEATNGELNGTTQTSPHVSDGTPSPKYSPKSSENEESDGEEEEEEEEERANSLDRSNRRRKRPQRYSEKDYVEAVSGNEADFDSDDDIVGEAVYDDDYLKNRKQHKVSSSSDGDEEYRWEDNAEEEEEEEEEEEDLSTSDGDSDKPRKYRKPRLRSRSKRKSGREIQSGLRRSKRAKRSRINYRQYEVTDTDEESEKPDKSNASEATSDSSNEMEVSTASPDSENHDEGAEQVMEEKKINEPVEKQQHESIDNIEENDQGDRIKKRRFLDLNELAPVTGFDDGPNSLTKDNDTNNP